MTLDSEVADGNKERDRDREALTLMPSNLDRALSGLRALRVLSDLMAAKSE